MKKKTNKSTPLFEIILILILFGLVSLGNTVSKGEITELVQQEIASVQLFTPALGLDGQ